MAQKKDSENFSETGQTAERIPAQTQPTPENGAGGTVIPEMSRAEETIRLLSAENQSLREKIQEMRKAMAQRSDAQKQNVVEEALVMPKFEFGEISRGDEKTLKLKQDEYARKMAEYMRAEVMKELAPVIKQAKDGIAQKEKADVIAALSAVPAFKGFSDMMPQIENIIANNKIFSSPDVPLDEKYVTAYLIALGINGKKKETEEMTPEKFMKLYNSNAKFRDLVDKQKLDEFKGSHQIPPFSASGGAVNAALNIPKTPSNFDEAHRLSKKFFE